MLFRVAGALAVMIGSVGLGLYYAAKESFRVQDLLEFKKALLILSSEIEYMRSPLAVACANIAKRTSLGAQRLFGRFSEALTGGDGETAYQLWLASMEKVRERCFFAEEDWSVIEGFGKTLGYLDKQMQQNAITYAVNYIDEKAAALQIQSDKNRRMYRSLGVIGGLLITVVLW
ncbi:MAG: stage III sporulation protein AB [Defluviitaleaceae bacterium]|nr:stage III sporulation protein AB [Defluviitaleaceae bacterium]